MIPTTEMHNYEWEPLAYELCVEDGHEPMDMIWDMHPNPEPWGERWLKYEDEAKRMIELVRKCTEPQYISRIAELEKQLAASELLYYNKGHADGRNLATLRDDLDIEDIEECCCFLDVELNHRYESNAVIKDIDWRITGIKDFVKAILKKANEK